MKGRIRQFHACGNRPGTYFSTRALCLGGNFQIRLLPGGRVGQQTHHRHPLRDFLPPNSDAFDDQMRLAAGHIFFKIRVIGFLSQVMQIDGSLFADAGHPQFRLRRVGRTGIQIPKIHAQAALRRCAVGPAVEPSTDMKTFMTGSMTATPEAYEKPTPNAQTIERTTIHM